MFAGLRDPLRAMLFTVGGALLAWLWTRNYAAADDVFAPIAEVVRSIFGDSVKVGPTIAIALVAVVLIASLALSGLGKSQVGLNDKRAMTLMETRLVSIGVLTAAGAALGIIASVELATDVGGYREKLASVVSGAIVSFLAGVTYTADKVDAAVGKYIAAEFQAVYAQSANHRKRATVDSGSDAQRAIMSSQAFGLVDWTRDNRQARIGYLTEENGWHPPK